MYADHQSNYKTSGTLMITLPTSRIPPITAAEWTEATRDVFEVMGGAEAREKGSPYNVVLTLAQHPELALPHLQFYKVLLSCSTLSMQLRELITLRVAWRTQSEYEWIQHVKLGKRVGLTDEHIESIKIGAELPLWSELERLSIRAVDQLFVQSQIDDATWNGLAQHMNKKELIELLFIIGTYTTLCWAFNAMGVKLENS
jgi:4-carboxymuconolactone decarboxylase